jgi:hypothetical protein
MIMTHRIGFLTLITPLILLSGAAFKLEELICVSANRFKKTYALFLYALHFKENSWVLTREQFPDDLTIAITQAVIDSNNLQEKYETTKHENCPADP